MKFRRNIVKNCQLAIHMSPSLTAKEQNYVVNDHLMTVEPKNAVE